jgi:hypothetical protein
MAVDPLKLSVKEFFAGADDKLEKDEVNFSTL